MCDFNFMNLWLMRFLFHRVAACEQSNNRTSEPNLMYTENQTTDRLPDWTRSSNKETSRSSTNIHSIYIYATKCSTSCRNTPIWFFHYRNLLPRLCCPPDTLELTLGTRGTGGCRAVAPGWLQVGVLTTQPLALRA